MIDWQTLAIGLLSIICTVGGWFLRVLWEASERLRTDLGKLEIELPKQYVRKEDYKDDIREMKNILTEIWQALKEKADKP